MKQKIRIFIPDAGPLISLAMGDALDLFLLLSADVRLIITDVVNYEVTHRSEKILKEKKTKESQRLCQEMLVKFQLIALLLTCEHSTPASQLWFSWKIRGLKQMFIHCPGMCICCRHQHGLMDCRNWD
jgi:hypothetical protein